MGAIVFSPLTRGTFSTDRLDPQMKQVDHVFLLAEAVELDLWVCLSQWIILGLLRAGTDISGAFSQDSTYFVSMDSESVKAFTMIM